MRDLEKYLSYRYHQLTKHSASSLYSEQHYLDWENQPNPFRIYEGTEIVPLERCEETKPANFFRPPERASNLNVYLKTLSSIFYYSLSISAWKKHEESTWHLRVNPSAGNLHPEEIHLISYNIQGLQAGIYHYNVLTHSLETRSNLPLDGDEWDAIGINKIIAERFKAFFIVNMISWRQAWKYQSRSLRYCLHDSGHVIGSLQHILEQIGLSFKVFVNINSKNLKKQLGLEKSDEFPLIVIGIGENSKTFIPNREGRAYKGKANALSDTEANYTLIDEVKELDISLTGPNDRINLISSEEISSTKIKPIESIKLSNESEREAKNYFAVVRGRRSAQAYDRESEIDRDDLAMILKKAFIVPESDYKEIANSLINLYFFAHRVRGLDQGLYLYDALRSQIYLLQKENLESTARRLSLSQEIASDSSLSFVMVADFSLAFDCLGEIGYRAVHFEAGRIGQALYLGSESLGFNSTGIGAFFDDDLNRFLKLNKGHEVIYNFAMGKAIPDKRIQTLDAYYHLNSE